MLSILITGATGFIGNHLLPQLIRPNWQVRACVRQFPIHPILGISYFKIGDINRDTDWRTVLKDVDVVIHLAARAHILNDRAPDPQAEFHQVNTEGTINLATQAIEAGIKHFIFLSSIGAMASFSNKPLSEDSPCQPDTPYGRSKLLAEQRLIALATPSAMQWTILRPPLVYGPCNPGNMERLIKLVDRAIPLPLGAIQNRRSLLYVGNLVDAILTCIDHPAAARQIFVVSDGQDFSTPELIRQIAHALYRPVHLLPVPPTVMRLTGQLTRRSTAIDRLLSSLPVDSTKIQTLLSWSPLFTFTQGIAATADWYIQSKLED